MAKRFLFSEFGARKRPFPNGLEFLKESRFHAIIERKINGRLKRTIEILPKSLKPLIENAAHVKELSNKRDQLETENELLKKSLPI